MKIQIDKNPTYYQKLTKGTANGMRFTISDTNGEVYVSFDKLVNDDQKKIQDLINKIKEEYLTNKIVMDIKKTLRKT